MWRLLAFCAFLSFILVSGTVRAQTIDPHAVFEQKCSRCHTRHGGEFARKTLTIRADGRIAGRKSDIPLESFLAQHSGFPSSAEIAALIEMFANQLRSGGLYAQKCRICHVSAKKLARVRLETKKGRLVNRITGRDIKHFLEEHGRLDDGEVDIINRLLIWQLQTAGR